MAETGWGKPTTDGVYWWRLSTDDTPDPVTVRGDFAYDTGYPEPTSTSLGEFLGPISPSDAEQLMELQRLAMKLIEAAQFSLSTPGFIRGRDELHKHSEALRAVLTPKHQEEKETQEK